MQETSFVPDHSRTVAIDYTNHRGERAWRIIDIMRYRFGSSEWHPEPQPLLVAWCHEKRAVREFALCDIHQTKRNVK